jgi:hypothetical protein
MLDRLLLVSKGKMMFEGQVKDVLPCFESFGKVCPAHYNPADYILNEVNSDFSKEIDVNVYEQKYLEFRSQKPDAETAPGEDLQKDGNRDGHSNEALNKHFQDLKSYKANFMTHFCSLFYRNIMNNILNPGTFGVRLVMYIMLALLVGLMYVDLDDDTDHSGVNSRTSLFFYVAAFFIFMTIAAMPFFMMERAIFEKEKLNKLYGSVPYAFSQTIAAIPGVFLITLISSILIVFMCGLNNFGVFLCDMFLMLLVGE